MTARKHARAQLIALSIGGFGAFAAAALGYGTTDPVTSHEAIETAAFFLDDAPTDIVLGQRAEQAHWAVDAPSGRAWVDAASGELIEISFEADAAE